MSKDEILEQLTIFIMIFIVVQIMIQSVQLLIRVFNLLF
jgi:hypothetical protein